MEGYFQVVKSTGRPKGDKESSLSTSGASSSKDVEVSGASRQHSRLSSSNRYAPYPSTLSNVSDTRQNGRVFLPKIKNVRQDNKKPVVLIEILDSSSSPPVSPGKVLVSSQESQSSVDDPETRRVAENVARVAAAARRRKDILNMKSEGNPIVCSKAVEKTRKLAY